MGNKKELQDRLIYCMEKYGNVDERTVKASQDLDKIIVAEQRLMMREE